MMRLKSYLTFPHDNSTQIKCLSHPSQLQGKILFELSKIGPISISQILAKCNGLFLLQWFCSVRSPCALKSSFAWSWNRVSGKFWSQYLEYLQNYLEIFIRHLAAAVPFLESSVETNNISPVLAWDILSRYDLFWLLVLRKIVFCLQRSGIKYQFSFGPNGAQLGALWWSTLRSTLCSY